MNPRRLVRRAIRLAKLTSDPRCLYCRKKLWEHNSTLDHIIPISKGGTDTAENLALCCGTCNACKDHRSLSEWIRDLAAALNSTIPPVRRIDGHKPAH